MGQVHPVARVHQPIDQPVPIIGGFHDHALHGGPIGLQRSQDKGQIIPQALLIQHLIGVITHNDHTIGGMEIDSRITLHGYLLVKVDECRRVTRDEYSILHRRSLRDDYRESFPISREKSRLKEPFPTHLLTRDFAGGTEKFLSVGGILLLMGRIRITR